MTDHKTLHSVLETLESAQRNVYMCRLQWDQCAKAIADVQAMLDTPPKPDNGLLEVMYGAISRAIDGLDPEAVNRGSEGVKHARKEALHVLKKAASAYKVQVEAAKGGKK